MRVGLRGLGVSLLLAVAGAGQLQDLPRATTAHGGFAFPDRHGARLLLPAMPEGSELLKTALCTRGRREVVRFAGRQTASGGGNGRDTPANFDHLAGSLFALPTGRVDPEATCFLASDSLLGGGTLLTFRDSQGSDGCAQRYRLASLRGRPIVQCWPLAALDGGRHVALVQFERRGSDALASVALIDRDRAILADYPATFHGPGQDLWRADDGGQLAPDGMQVVFVLQRDAWYALGLAWSAAEGRSLSLWIAEDGERFVEVIREYWYQAPI